MHGSLGSLGKNLESYVTMMRCGKNLESYVTMMRCNKLCHQAQTSATEHTAAQARRYLLADPPPIQRVCREDAEPVGDLAEVGLARVFFRPL